MSTRQRDKYQQLSSIEERYAAKDLERMELIKEDYYLSVHAVTPWFAEDGSPNFTRAEENKERGDDVAD